MQINITEILGIVITLIGAIVTYLVIPYIKSKTTKAQYDNIIEWITTAVKAYEVIYKESGKGSEKRQDVIDYIVKKATKANIKIDLEDISLVIEKVWKEMQSEVTTYKTSLYDSECEGCINSIMYDDEQIANDEQADNINNSHFSYIDMAIEGADKITESEKQALRDAVRS